MKFLKFSIAVLLMTAVFASCEKEKDVITFKEAPPESPIPDPPPSNAPILGTFMGSRHGLDKSIPYYFGFQIKDQGILDVLNEDKRIIGSGEWKFDNNVFTATYTISSSGQQYSVKSDPYYSGDLPDKIGGTWGHGNNNEGNGFWNMKRMN